MKGVEIINVKNVRFFIIKIVREFVKFLILKVRLEMTSKYSPGGQVPKCCHFDPKKMLPKFLLNL